MCRCAGVQIGAVLLLGIFRGMLLLVKNALIILGSWYLFSLYLIKMYAHKNSSDNLIVNLSFQFAIKIVAFTEILEMDRKYCLAKQLFRSGTSIGANVREAQGAESLGDFIHKIKVAYKEAEETRYWLEICMASDNYPRPTQLIIDIESLVKILGKILSTSINKKLTQRIMLICTFAHLHICTLIYLYIHFYP